MSLDALMRRLVPQGYFVPVTPGTRYVTVGGALAADIHGKNHHIEGSFANHLQSFTLRAPKETVVAEPGTETDVFWTTAGALGLTGVVTDVTMRMLPIESSLMLIDTERVAEPRRVDGADGRGRRPVPLLRRLDRLPPRRVARSAGRC